MLRDLFVKTFALFTVVRGYNVAMLMLAQYMASLFIFNDGMNHFQILLDKNLNFIILASALSASAGYIINNFYDLEKDNISRPLTNYIGRFISHQFKLNVYLALNIFALGIAALVSWKVFAFFLGYQFMVWFYSHKVNKIAWLNNLYSVLLMVMPFFALFLYYENFSPIIFYHAAFLILLLLITDVIKDLTTSTADAVYNYSTLPVIYGESATKKFITVLTVLISALSVFMWSNSETGYMKYFFIFTAVIVLLLLIVLWRSRSRTVYKMLHLIFKLLIGFGIFNMVFIDLNPLALQKLL